MGLGLLTCRLHGSRRAAPSRVSLAAPLTRVCICWRGRQPSEAKPTRAALAISLYAGYSVEPTARCTAERGTNPNWRMSDVRKEYVATEAPEIRADNYLRDYVGGAFSQADYERRLGMAQQQADFQRRAAQSGWTSPARQLLAGAGDPVMLVATLGAGSIANAARAAFAVRAAAGVTGVVSSMVEGSAGFLLLGDQIIRASSRGLLLSSACTVSTSRVFCGP
ncbi:hypothetical protein TR70_0227 [Burkholderia pseudomallei]|nr:hypothetical protein TR70_0227 [Burkholderia pseudomallei]